MPLLSLVLGDLFCEVLVVARSNATEEVLRRLVGFRGAIDSNEALGCFTDSIRSSREVALKE